MKFLKLNQPEKAKLIEFAAISLHHFPEKIFSAILEYFKANELKVDLNTDNLILIEDNLSTYQKVEIDKFLDEKYSSKYKSFDEELIKIPIQESEEEMVSIHELCQKHKLKVSFNSVSRIIQTTKPEKHERAFYFRKGLSDSFIKLAQLAAKLGFSVHILDAYRSEKIQKASYLRTYLNMKKLHPDKSEKEIIIQANAKTAFAPWVAGHMSGAALDIQIHKDGKAIDIGNEYLPSGSICNMDFPLLTPSQLISRLLFESLVQEAGFTVYPAENWHISLGDITANYDSKFPSQYGPIKSFDQESGKVLKYEDKQEIYENFQI